MSHNLPNPLHVGAQRGVVLIIGLLLLLIMSMIGISMMSGTSLEIMMAGSTRESNIALQATEAALRDAEASIEDNATDTGATFGGHARVGHTTGLYDGSETGELDKNTPEPPLFDAATWTADISGTILSIEYQYDYPEMPAYGKPRYIVKHLGEVPLNVVGQDITPGGAEGPKVSMFRNTARGTSRDGSAVTILQSYYGKMFPQ